LFLHEQLKGIIICSPGLVSRPYGRPPPMLQTICINLIPKVCGIDCSETCDTLEPNDIQPMGLGYRFDDTQPMGLGYQFDTKPMGRFDTKPMGLKYRFDTEPMGLGYGFDTKPMVRGE
jgi:hypothetical protein